MVQMVVPCVIYRGGTSRGLFFHETDLPDEEIIREQIFLKGIGAEDISHINGLGAGTSHTSKVVIINKSERPDADIDYNFVQLGVGNDIIDYEGTCGNLMAAAGAFAVDEGVVVVSENQKSVIIKAWSVNIHKRITIRVPLSKGKAQVMGDFFMAGVHDPGAKFLVDIENPGGGKTGNTLPLGPVATMEKTELDYTFCDLVNPFVYIEAGELGLNGTELNEEVMQQPKLLKKLEDIRVKTAVESGLAPDLETALTKRVALPKVSYVSEPKDYSTSDGTKIKKEDYDILARMVSMKKIHRTFAVSGLLNIAGACLLNGTLPNRVCELTATGKEQFIRIGHPEGITVIRVQKKQLGKTIDFVGLSRTARRMMAGDLYIPVMNEK